MATKIEFRESLRIAVIGDPHFHRESNTSRSGISHIRLDEKGEFLSSQGQQNPWIGLQSMIKSQDINADILICVGDITYGADGIGLRKAWKELNDLSLVIGAEYLVTATGNHDVSSRSTAEKVGKNPSVEMSAAVGLFEPLKLLSPTYPIVGIQGTQSINHPLLRTKYFGDSLVLLESDKYRILVLNSCCEHSADAFQQERGSFPKSAQLALHDELKNTPSQKINILVCHHPPEPHSEHNLGGHDFIENGEALIQFLEEHGSWFIVHGHKHHGRIAYAKGSTSAPIVFSAASMGIQLDSALDGMRNQFYCIDVLQKSSGQLYGKVAAWDWNMGLGWRKANRVAGGIYDGCGFGARQPTEDLAEYLAQLVPCNWNTALEKIPALGYLTPNDMKILEKRLLNKHSIVVQPDGQGYWSELLPKIS